MRKLFMSLLLVPMMALAGNVKSPNGNIELKFTIDDGGQKRKEFHVRRDLAACMG